MEDIEFWVIMDKSKKAIACGSPRNREMRLVENLGKIRVMLYGTEAKAKSAFTDVGFYDETFTKDQSDFTKSYLRKTYGQNFNYDDICIAVKARLVFE